jgi:hypothetical protein
MGGRQHKKENSKVIRGSFFLSSSISGDGRLGLLRLVVVFDFHCTNDYTMANNMFLLIIVSIRG